LEKNIISNFQPIFQKNCFRGYFFDVSKIFLIFCITGREGKEKEGEERCAGPEGRMKERRWKEEEAGREGEWK